MDSSPTLSQCWTSNCILIQNIIWYNKFSAYWSLIWATLMKLVLNPSKQYVQLECISSQSAWNFSVPFSSMTHNKFLYFYICNKSIVTCKSDAVYLRKTGAYICLVVCMNIRRPFTSAILVDRESICI